MHLLSYHCNPSAIPGLRTSLKNISKIDQQYVNKASLPGTFNFLNSARSCHFNENKNSWPSNNSHSTLSNWPCGLYQVKCENNSGV